MTVGGQMGRVRAGKVILLPPPHKIDTIKVKPGSHLS